MPDPQSCANCTFARPITGVPTNVALDCCAEVPRILAMEPIEPPDTRQRWGFWPAVRPNAWCGQWKPAPQAAQLPANLLQRWCQRLLGLQP